MNFAVQPYATALKASLWQSRDHQLCLLRLVMGLKEKAGKHSQWKNSTGLQLSNCEVKSEWTSAVNCQRRQRKERRR